MSPFIPAWMFECGLSSHEGWVLAYLWRCRNADTGQCNPSAETIAEKTGMSLRKVFSCIKSLKAKNLVQVKSGNSSSSNKYVLTMHGMQRTMHHMHTKVLKEVNTNNNLGMHHMHGLPRSENLGVLRSGELHSRFLSVLKPTLSPNAYRDYRVEVLGDGFATVIDLYGGRLKKEIAQ